MPSFAEVLAEVTERGAFRAPPPPFSFADSVRAFEDQLERSSHRSVSTTSSGGTPKRMGKMLVPTPVVTNR
jgi:hypothetical protein